MRGLLPAPQEKFEARCGEAGAENPYQSESLIQPTSGLITATLTQGRPSCLGPTAGLVDVIPSG